MSGIFGVYHKKTEGCINDLLFGTDYNFHLGTERAGLAFLSDSGEIWRRIHDISTGAQLKDKFGNDLGHLKTRLRKNRNKVNFGIGVISDCDDQPLIIDSRFGKFAIVAMGMINNLSQLSKDLLKDRTLTQTGVGINTIEVVAELICQSDNFVDGIQNLWSKIEGSLSLLILTEDGKLLAARDRFGVTPLVFGKKPDGFAITGESGALYNLGYNQDHYLKPGEIVEITASGLKILVEGDNDKCRLCAFLYIYTGFPTSCYENQSVECARNRCGVALAQRDFGKIKADLVAGVPDSGIGHAVGYSNESKVPYARPLIKYTPCFGRSYTPADQRTRDIVAKMKLIPVPDIIKDKKIILLDDSIVRGTQLKDNTLAKLWNSGAKEIHVRPACPPLLFPCYYLLSTRNIDELAARIAIKEITGSFLVVDDDVSAYLDPNSDKYTKMVEKICKKIGATSLMYQRLDDMIKAIGISEEKLCTYCWTGKKIS